MINRLCKNERITDTILHNALKSVTRFIVIIFNVLILITNTFLQFCILFVNSKHRNQIQYEGLSWMAVTLPVNWLRALVSIIGLTVVSGYTSFDIRSKIRVPPISPLIFTRVSCSDTPHTSRVPSAELRGIMQQDLRASSAYSSCQRWFSPGF